jgi:hypothetical protein
MKRSTVKLVAVVTLVIFSLSTVGLAFATLLGK